MSGYDHQEFGSMKIGDFVLHEKTLARITGDGFTPGELWIKELHGNNALSVHTARNLTPIPEKYQSEVMDCYLRLERALLDLGTLARIIEIEKGISNDTP